MNDQSHLSRRDFLKDAAVGATGAAVVGSLAASRILGANDRIRIAVIGCGGRAQSLMRRFNTSSANEIMAVCDVYGPHRAEALQYAAPGAQAYLDYREILDRHDIDAVLIGSPDHWHKTMLIDAVRAGKDAYLEKPIMHSIEEGIEMVRAVEETKRVVQTGTQQRSWEHYLLGKQLVDSGKLGRIIYVHTYWYQNYLERRADLPSVDTGQLDWKKWLGSAPDQPFSPEKFRLWRHYWDFGGGILTDLLTHWIDVIQWYMGQPAPLTATTTGRTYLFKWQAPDAITATFEFPGDFMVTFTGAYNSSIDDGGIEFRGSEATLKIDREHLAVFPEGVKWAPGKNAPEPEILVRSEHDGTLDHVKNFLDCVRNRKTPSAPIQAGHEAARTGWIANLALKRGAKVNWDVGNGRLAP
ncbi:MAG: Gfo/Idh/MocA family oxidoreductase [Acidobacteriia bacterium]|nr:Gfo/Idh/MocA family oxidoreductase [Terriglobia bacterium]